MIDTSASTYGERIHQIEAGLNEALEMIANDATNTYDNVIIHILQFNSVANWVAGDMGEGVSVQCAIRQGFDLKPSGVVDTALAIEECIKRLKSLKFGLRRSRKPIIILITDGHSIDQKATEESIDKLKVVLGGKAGKDKTVRYGIGIDDYSEEELTYFATKGNMIMENGEIKSEVPFVFEVDEDSKIAETIKRVVKISIEQRNRIILPISPVETIDVEPIIIDTSPNADNIWDEN